MIEQRSSAEADKTEIRDGATPHHINSQPQLDDNGDLLNQAHIASKPVDSVLDDLENFWEKNDAIKGISKRGIMAEHIM